MNKNDIYYNKKIFAIITRFKGADNYWANSFENHGSWCSSTIY